ncbi:hypothetical protein B9Z55_027952 [Caenorhabditis nigoni]|uniref:Uncharacterized protein n=1 Tax=Caenorhabditis nigoni TaxID=1611254 RepID=A0A2G5SDR4_9PELO|nr:hypothetical protein B9Z55_027952 [Caenorhabditis nigoni]
MDFFLLLFLKLLKALRRHGNEAPSSFLRIGFQKEQRSRVSSENLIHGAAIVVVARSSRSNQEGDFGGRGATNHRRRGQTGEILPGKNLKLGCYFFDLSQNEAPQKVNDASNSYIFRDS